MSKNAHTILAKYEKRKAISMYIFESGRNGSKNACRGMSSNNSIAVMPNEKIIKLYDITPVIITETIYPRIMMLKRNPWKKRISSLRA
ncbi:MAG: hypothetical protein WAW59_02750 [Patescibacteria group bacterium]